MICGVDCGITATNPTAVVFYYEGACRVTKARHISSNAAHYLDRCRHIWAEVARELLMERAELIAIEGAHYGPNAQTGLKLAILAGGLLQLAHWRGIQAYLIQPAQSKLALAGSGRASKADMVAAAARFTPPDFGKLSPHQADALGAAFAALEIQNGHQNIQRQRTRHARRNPTPEHTDRADAERPPRRNRKVRASVAAEPHSG